MLLPYLLLPRLLLLHFLTSTGATSSNMPLPGVEPIIDSAVDAAASSSAAAAAALSHLNRRHFIHDAIARLPPDQNAPHRACCSNAQALWQVSPAGFRWVQV
jgi:hypothetical protein